jgi:tetratricopeptide (TPR) repeat protein
MSAGRRVAVLVVGTALLATGCRTHTDIHSRYTLERKLWQAQKEERKINIGFVRASQKSIAAAIRDFNLVVDYDPLSIHSTGDWDPNVIGDIRRIQIVSRIALANLYFLNESYHAAGDFYSRALGDADLDFQKKLDVRLDLARSMYLAGESDLLESNCALIFEEILQSEDFWQARFELKDIFLSIPLVMCRLYRERGDDERYQEFSVVADDFYSRVAQTWPESLVAAKAMYARVSLNLMHDRWTMALADIESLLKNPRFKERTGNLMLLKAEIYAYGKNDPKAAVPVLEEILRILPNTQMSYAATYDLATIALDDGRTEEGLGLLKQLESGDLVSSEIASKALLTRALALERAKRWDEALSLLRRVTRLYPNTRSAVEAPLVITRHYIANNNRQLAERNLERATEFYVSLLTRQSKYRGDRLLVQDFLIENYLTMGRTEEVAGILENRALDWDEVSTVGGMFKSALLYSAMLDDYESASRVLKKSIELFPETRYAKIAERQLESISKENAGDPGGGGK